MNFRELLPLATTLLGRPTEAAWRTAISRTYYAAFHVGCRLFRDLGFTVPRSDRAHSYLWLRLSNCSHSPTQYAAVKLQQLREARNRADYDDRFQITQAQAQRYVQDAEDIIRELDVAALEPTRTQITDAMKIYEQQVLKDVTWKP